MGKKIFANYEILKKIGEGGMGAVYLARDLSLEREVAIKIIAPELARHSRLISRFRVEAIAQAKLNHTNIVTIHSFSQEKNIYYIVMEYVDGKSLNVVLKENLPLIQSLEIFSQILEGVAYAHSQGVVHRDIKPANIFFTSDQTAKIGDFGIAKIEGIEGITRVGTAMGSPVYSSPEQLLGETIDGRTDIYSLGITLYEMLTCKPYLKITGDTDYTAIKKALEYEPQKPSAVNPEIPVSLDEIVMKSIAKNPAKRFQDVKELNRAIRKVISNLATVPEITAGKFTEQKSPIKNAIPKTLMFNKKQIVIASASFSVIFITLIFLIFSGSSDPLIKTTQGKITSKGIQPIIDSTKSKKHSVVQPRKVTAKKPKEISLTAETDPLFDTIIEMNWNIKKGHYQVAINLGKETIRERTVNAKIYLIMAQSYYCDGRIKQARIYYMKALKDNNYLKFNIAYHKKKDLIIDGELGINREDIYFTSSDESLRPYAFTLSLDLIQQVSLDISRRLKKKRDRNNTKLIIMDTENNKYPLMVRESYKKSGSFIKDIINTLRKM